MEVNLIGVLDAVREWRDARMAFWPPVIPRFERHPPERWARLEQAEQRLMELAEKI